MNLEDLLTKENRMNLENLITLASGEDGFRLLPQIAIAAPAIKEALQRKFEKAKEEAAENAAEQIIEMLKSAEEANKANKQSIRQLKRRIEAHKKVLNERNLAVEYGLSTNNWLPLAVILEGRHRLLSVDEKLLKIPDGWVPPPKAG